MKRSKNAAERMRISFDLDEVLFVSPDTHKTEEELSFPFNKIYIERLRYGTKDLIPKLQAMGCEVWVYTSSFRTESYIKRLFRHYGIHFDGIVNGERHLREVQGNRKETVPNKMPCKYRISLHVDDETVIMINGKTHGFEVFLLNAQDDEWEEKIIERVNRIRRREAAKQRQNSELL